MSPRATLFAIGQAAGGNSCTGACRGSAWVGCSPRTGVGWPAWGNGTQSPGCRVIQAAVDAMPFYFDDHPEADADNYPTHSPTSSWPHADPGVTGLEPLMTWTRTPRAVLTVGDASVDPGHLIVMTTDEKPIAEAVRSRDPDAPGCRR